MAQTAVNIFGSPVRVCTTAQKGEREMTKKAKPSFMDCESSKTKELIRYLDEHYKYRTVRRVVRNIVLARYDWLGRFGLIIGEASVEGKKVLVGRYAQTQERWWIWDDGDGDPR